MPFTPLAGDTAELWTVGWLLFPLLTGFLIALFPKLDRVLALGGAIVSALYDTQLFLTHRTALSLH